MNSLMYLFWNGGSTLVCPIRRLGGGKGPVPTSAQHRVTDWAAVFIKFHSLQFVSFDWSVHGLIHTVAAHTCLL